MNGTPLAQVAFERRRGAAGTVTLDLTITANGALERCDVVDQSGVGNIDRPVCNALRAGRFRPARDSEGAAVPALTRYTYTIERSQASSVRPIKVDFAIPVDHLPAAATRPAVDVLVVSGPDSKVSDCVVGTTSGNLILDHLACATMATAELTPARDRNGQPIRAIRELAVGFVVTPSAIRQ